jgi:hypothetical protein
MVCICPDYGKHEEPSVGVLILACVKEVRSGSLEARAYPTCTIYDYLV